MGEYAMRFERARLRVLAACFFSSILMGGLFGCSEKLPKRSIELDKGELGCLDGFSDKIESFFVGKLPEAEVDGLFGCASGTIDKFMVYVGGSEQGVYRPDELVEFIETYFLRNTKISKNLVQEAMVLKSVVFGGTEESLTEGDLRRVQRFFSLLRDEMKRLRPYMPFSLERLNAMTPVEKDEVLGKFRESAQEFGRFFEETVGSYSFANFERFVDELDHIFENRAGIEGLRWARDNIYLFRVAKVFANYTPGSQIFKEEWKRLFQIGIRWACFGLELSYYLHHHSDQPFADAALDSLESILNEGFNLVEDAIRLRPGRILSFNEISTLLQDSFRDGKFPFIGADGVPISLLIRSIRPFTQHFLGGPGGNLIPWDGDGIKEPIDFDSTNKLLESDCNLPREQAGRCLNGISLPSLRFLKSKLSLWMESQHLVNRVYRELGALPTDPDPRFPKRDVLRMVRSHSSGEVGADVLAQVIGSIEPFRVFYRERSFSMTSDPLGQEPALSHWQVANFSWIRLMTQLFIGAYAEGDRGQRAFGIQVPEFKKFYFDFKDIGIELGFFDPRYDDSPEKRTREANLFTSVGNGDKTITVEEATEEFANLLSLKRLANLAHSEIADVCPVYGVDVMYFPKIDADCYKREYANRLWRYWKPRFPALLRYYGYLADVDKKEFLRTLEIAARRPEQITHPDPLRPGVMIPDAPFEVEDSEGYSALLHYTQALILRFDENHDGKIDEAETRKVFPIVRGELRALSGRESDGDNFAILTYLMKYGTRPSATQFLAWRAREYPVIGWIAPWSVEADQFSILRIFALLGTTATPP